MNTKHGTLHESVSKLLVEKLSVYKTRSLKKDVCISIYSTIFQCLENLFTSSNVQITNESLNWIAQSYYDAVTINENQELDPNIFTQRASLQNVDTKELALLSVMLKDSPFYPEIVSLIRRRS